MIGVSPAWYAWDMKAQPKHLKISRDTLRRLAAAPVHGAERIQFSSPAVSCDSCTNCSCRPPA